MTPVVPVKLFYDSIWGWILSYHLTPPPPDKLTSKICLLREKCSKILSFLVITSRFQFSLFLSSKTQRITLHWIIDIRYFSTQYKNFPAMGSLWDPKNIMPVLFWTQESLDVISSFWHRKWWKVLCTFWLI